MAARTIAVKVDPVVKHGTFANAFRIVEEVGPDCFLDFMVYSASEEEATVVSRVRIRREFLGEIRSQLGSALICFGGAVPEGDGATNEVDRKDGETVH